MKFPLLLASLAGLASAEVRTMTLRQAVDVALEQNPDVLVARLDQHRARDQVAVQRDAFLPKVYGGSGAAWTYGFPASIDGNAPSVFQAKTVMSIFDRPQSYQIAQAAEALRAAAIDVTARQDDAVFRVASLFLDAEQASRGLATAERQRESLARVRELVEVRVAEGRELPIEARRASINEMRAVQHVNLLSADLTNAETALAQVLGLDPGDRVRAAVEDRRLLELPASEDGSIEQALENNKDLKRLQSNLQIKSLEVKSARALRLPKINLVAQYSLLTKYNNYADYFQRFSRNNAQVGASFEIPLLGGRAPTALQSQAEADAAKLRVEVARTRGRITADVRRAYQDARRAEQARELARADLDLAREQLSLDLAQMDEGRVPLAKVEADRATEQEKWLAYYDSQRNAEVARLTVLHQTGNLLAALR